MASLESSLRSVLSTAYNAQTQIIKSDAQFENALANSKARGLPAITIWPAQGQYLSILCQLINAKNVLEIGTLGGYSTLWFANSAPDVQVTSIEIDPAHRSVAIENTKHMPNISIRLGAALDILPTLAAAGQVFDFVFIDADWDEQAQYFDWAVRLTRPRGCVYVDNAVRQLTESAPGDPKGTALIDHVKRDERVEASLVSTMNPHRESLVDSVDGFLIAYVK